MDNNLDAVFSALSDPTRRAVIAQLLGGPAPVSELHAPHAMALPTFMKHLSKLEAAGLVRSEKKGRVRTVHVETAPMAQAGDWIGKHQQMWQGRLDRLSLLASQMKGD